jgi:endoglycosylceramidase
MRVSKRSLALAMCIACALAAGSASVAQASPKAPQLPLGHSGRWITDAAGRVMIVHGTNMVYKLPPFYPSAVGFGSDDAAFLNSIGFDAVRVGVLWQALEPKPGVYDDGYLRHIAATVATLARHGIVSLLDFHQDQYNQLFQGEGFPDWSVQDDGLPPEPQLGFGADYVGMPALSRAFDHFWENSPGPGGIGLQDRYGAAWAHVARVFAGNRNVLGYEIMNEPWPGSIWPSCAQTEGCPTFDTGPFAAFYHRTIGAIRGSDRRPLIWYEPQVLFNYGSNTNLPALGDPRLGFAFHDYCLQHDEGAGTGTCQTLDDTVFSNALARVAKTGDALLETEFGATTDPQVLVPAVQRADRDMIPWLEWAYCGCSDPTTSGPGAEQAIVLDPRKPPRGANLNLPTLRILVEPYPQLVSGTPLSWGYTSATKTFSLRYSTARANGHGRFAARSLTAVATPGFVYGGRYAVQVSGGAIASRRGAGVLQVAACRGAKTITVTVRPSGRNRSSCRLARAARRPGSH